MTVVAIGTLVGAVAVGAGAWWGHRVHVATAPAPAAAAPVEVASPAAQTASVPSIQHPVPTLESLGEATPRTFESDFAELLTSSAMATMLRTDDFDHRFVATIDNLGRSAAPAGMWPVEPAKGRFQVATADDGQTTLSPDNSVRYLPYVQTLEHVDLREAIRAYVWHYPALQHQYEELGFPGHYFNDRFVQVLDQLLATPDVTAPPGVHLPTAAGTPPTRPWVLYEFDEPTLRSLTAGQRLLLRMGPANERRVKHRLAELRRLLASSAANQDAVRQARSQEAGRSSATAVQRGETR